MSFNYKPKHRKAPWVEAAGIKEQPKPRKYIARVSKRRNERGELRKYPEFARGIVRESRAGGRTCPVVNSIPELRDGKAYGCKISKKIRECHHLFGHGPNDELLCWGPGCMGVSKAGHRWIHSNPDEARKRGWLAPKGLFNNVKRVLSIWQSLATNEKLMDRMLSLCGY